MTDGFGAENVDISWGDGSVTGKTDRAFLPSR